MPELYRAAFAIAWIIGRSRKPPRHWQASMALAAAGFGWFVLLALAGCEPATAPKTLLVESGEARGQIVIADDPPRMVRLAAKELQRHIESMTGASLPVVSTPDPEVPATVFVGVSPHTEALGLSVDGLEDGAFRMVSGPGWLALLGRDADFVPREPWALHHGYLQATLDAWDAKTGARWGNPVGVSLYRYFNKASGLWAYDERGSPNAVYEFLRRQGVRWFMPGPLGEIVPKQSDLGFPAIDETIHPAFGLRGLSPLSDTYTGLQNEEDLLWHLRLGFNAHSKLLGAPPNLSHGLLHVLSRPEMRAAHPDYYALVNGKRDTARNHACLSNDDLVREAANFARALFDVYDLPSVSMMPEDGFVMCECSLCEGKETPERGRVGQHSDYVWNFVERVAREVATTHPDRTINCFAYGTYTLPPETIERLSPNVQAGIVHGRGWYYPQPTERGLELPLPELRDAWMGKTSRPLIGWEHYPFTMNGTFLPIFFPKAIARGLAGVRASSAGEKIEVAWGPAAVRGHGLHRPEFNHLNLYVTSRLQWDPDQDLDQLLDEYCRLFYGPAAEPMRAFIDYCEDNWQRMREDPQPVAAAIELFDRARTLAPEGSAYAARLDALGDYLLTLRQLGAQLANPRENVPELTIRGLTGAEADFPHDGNLDKTAWQPTRLMEYRGAALTDPASGKRPEIRTSFHGLWTGGRDAGILHLGILCEEPDTVRFRDPETADQDTVEILIETPAHSFYRIKIGRNGLIEDADCQGGQDNPRWNSKAEVATAIGDSFWSAEVRIPVPGADQLGDPLHEVAGRRPSATLPWHINLIRQHGDGEKTNTWSWSAPDGQDPRNPRAFGRLRMRH